jgi:hypothetical protein
VSGWTRQVILGGLLVEIALPGRSAIVNGDWWRSDGRAVRR